MTVFRYSPLTRSLRDHSPGRRDNVGWRPVELADEAVDRGPAHRMDLELPLFRLGEEFRVPHGVIEGLAQRLSAISGHFGRCQERPSHLLPAEHQLENLPL